jgi:ribonuclease D
MNWREIIPADCICDGFEYNEHMLITNLPDPIWVDQALMLENMMAHLMREPIVAVDTESNSLYVYQEQVCLIQISTSTRDYLVDSLTLTDLSCLNALFSSTKIEKVFHAADYDLVCLKRDFGFEFANLFDTMIAGRTLGMDSVGLAAMLQSAFGVQVDKHYQRANWGQRPLSAEMLAYARRDSHYLIPLRDKLVQELIKMDRLALVMEDCAYLAKNSSPMQNHTADMWRIRGINQLKPKQLAALKSLYEFREMIAKTNNKPPFKIMSNQALLEVAQTLPRYFPELELLPSLSKNQVQRYGRGLLQAVKSSARVNVTVPANHYHFKEVLQARKEKLGEWRKDAGLHLGVPSDVILSKEIMNQIAEVNPQTVEAMRAVMADTPIRFNQFGEEILAVLKKGRIL